MIIVVLLSPQEKYLVSILNYITTASFHIPTNSLFTVMWPFYAVYGGLLRTS